MFKQISAPRTKLNLYNACRQMRMMLDGHTLVYVCFRTPSTVVGRPVLDVYKRKRWFESASDLKQMTFDFDEFRPRLVHSVNSFSGGFELRIGGQYYLVYRDFKGRPENCIITGLEVYVMERCQDNERLVRGEDGRLNIVEGRTYTDRRDIQTIGRIRVVANSVPWGINNGDIRAITFRHSAVCREDYVELETSSGTRHIVIDSRWFNREFNYANRETQYSTIETGRTRWVMEPATRDWNICRSPGQYSVGLP
jgi:hypothetical protein